MKNPWADLPDLDFEVGDSVFLPNVLPRGETHMAIICGQNGIVRAAFPDRGKAAVDFGERYGIQLVPYVSIRKNHPFTPGLFRRSSEPSGYGYETRWFDRAPNAEWVRI